nr:ribonuclease H-like domain-containing protein [Tanacetum cinerariifolium]
MTYTDKELDNVLDISHLKIKVCHPNGTEAYISKVENLRLSNGLTLYDVMVIPEYFVTLIFVHKLVKENKVIVAFDENRCYFLNQDLNQKNVLGIGDQYERLYYYNDQVNNSRNDADSSDEFVATQNDKVATLEENVVSDGNLNQNPSSSHGVQNVRRSSRQSVFPRNYNDFIVESKVKHEMDALLRNGTWEILELPEGRKAIRSKWIYKIKFRKYAVLAVCQIIHCASGLSFLTAVEVDSHPELRVEVRKAATLLIMQLCSFILWSLAYSETLNAGHSHVYDNLGDYDQRCQYYGAAFWYGEPLSRTAILEANDSVCLPPQIGPGSIKREQGSFDNRTWVLVFRHGDGFRDTIWLGVCVCRRKLTKDCLKKEIDRVDHYLHSRSRPKLIAVSLSDISERGLKSSFNLLHVTPPTAIQKISDNNSAPKLQSKRKNYVS